MRIVVFTISKIRSSLDLFSFDRRVRSAVLIFLAPLPETRVAKPLCDTVDRYDEVARQVVNDALEKVLEKDADIDQVLADAAKQIERRARRR